MVLETLFTPFVIVSSCSMRLHYSSREQASEMGRRSWVFLTIQPKDKVSGLSSHLTGR
jgi:hypothetical protein